jgi:hypothetical protein
VTVETYYFTYVDNVGALCGKNVNFDMYVSPNLSQNEILYRLSNIVCTFSFCVPTYICDSYIKGRLNKCYIQGDSFHNRAERFNRVNERKIISHPSCSFLHPKSGR